MKKVIGILFCISSFAYSADKIVCEMSSPMSGSIPKIEFNLKTLDSTGTEGNGEAFYGAEPYSYAFQLSAISGTDAHFHTTLSPDYNAWTKPTLEQIHIYLEADPLTKGETRKGTAVHLISKNDKELPNPVNIIRDIKEVHCRWE